MKIDRKPLSFQEFKKIMIELDEKYLSETKREWFLISYNPKLCKIFEEELKKQFINHDTTTKK